MKKLLILLALLLPPAEGIVLAQPQQKKPPPPPPASYDRFRGANHVEKREELSKKLMERKYELRREDRTKELRAKSRMRKPPQR
jgi:hypothetical protein